MTDRALPEPMPGTINVATEIDGLSLPAYYRSLVDDDGQPYDPMECSMFDCNDPALYFVAGWFCEEGCTHMHAIPAPMCAAHADRPILGTTGD